MELSQVVVTCPKRNAIWVRHAYKNYGNVQVLRDFSMTVQEGTIYGLLGASGCGKTTLLSCLVGRQRLDSGQLSVLGLRADDSNFEAVRSRIGYMPQDIALYGNFTIKETMLYFGWIFGMTSSDVEERLQFWIKLLHLPHSSSEVNNISGGQKRRVSLAVALLHDPDVMIMDEPTVGVDPVLRSIIWEHLIHLSSARRKTIIITTHYIEEARQAHKIGMIRNGRLLAEASPEYLLQNHSKDTLEDVFVLLSEQQEQQDSLQGAPVTSLCQEEESSQRTQQSKHEDFSDDTVFEEFPINRNSRSLVSAGRMAALLYKNCTSLWKDFWLMLYLFGQCLSLPVMVFYAFAGFPEDLPLAVVNLDRNSSGELGSGCAGGPPPVSCDLVNLSCRFLGYLTSPIFVTEFYNNTRTAVDAVREGRAWGSLHFGENYTAALAERSLPGNVLESDVIEQSNVDVRLDMSDYITSQHLMYQLYKTYEKFLSEIVGYCGFNPEIIHIPLRINDPVHGHSNPRAVDNFGAPMMIFIVYFLGVALSTPSIVFERRGGLLDRNIVAGVTSLEILLSHFLAQFLVLVSQVMVLFIIALYVIQLECVGSQFLLWSLTVLAGISGLIFGFSISTFAQSEISATLLANGCVVPLLLLSGNTTNKHVVANGMYDFLFVLMTSSAFFSLKKVREQNNWSMQITTTVYKALNTALTGIVWPMAGMQGRLAAAARWLPITLAVQAARAVTSRGTALPHPDVYMGFVGSGGWCLLFVALCTACVCRYRL